MKFIWLAPAVHLLPNHANIALHVQFADSPDVLPRIMGEGDHDALIVEVSSELAIEAAVSLVGRWAGVLPIWILDPNATVSTSLSWIKEGVAHVALSPDEIVERMMAQAEMSEPRRARRTALTGESRPIRNLEEQIELIADRRCNVLIEGETGTGKEVTARAIHAGGSRNRGPWVAVNCGAIPETLLEAELFGYVRGAFTGAVQSRAGKFEAANRGTIFLDEIGDMPIAVQGKLLRVLQEREIERLGGNQTIRLDVRVIAATNVNLEERVRKGSFRQDLFYRLNVFRLTMPPLRERAADIAHLALHFVAKICGNEQLPLKRLDPAALEKLLCHSWPGNVRELENTLESAVIVSGSRGTIFPGDISWTRSGEAPQRVEPGSETLLPPDGFDLERVLQDFEKNILAQALARTRGNKTAAANLLRLKRTTLSARMRALESRLPRLVA